MSCRIISNWCLSFVFLLLGLHLSLPDSEVLLKLQIAKQVSTQSRAANHSTHILPYIVDSTQTCSNAFRVAVSQVPITLPMSKGDTSNRHVSRRPDTSRTSSIVYSLADTSEHKAESPTRQDPPLARCLSIQFQSLPSELQPIGIDHALVVPSQNQLLSVHPHNHGPMVRYSAASDLASQCKSGLFVCLSPVV